MNILLPQLLKSGPTALSCSKHCNHLKQGVSKRIQPDLVIKFTRSGHSECRASTNNLHSPALMKGGIGEKRETMNL